MSLRTACLAMATLAAMPTLVAARAGTPPPSPAVLAVAVDLNSASVAQLAALPGMGVVYAHRIVEGRPYVAKNQLLTRGILPANAYQQIKDQIVAHRASAAALVENRSKKVVAR